MKNKFIKNGKLMSFSRGIKIQENGNPKKINENGSYFDSEMSYDDKIKEIETQLKVWKEDKTKMDKLAKLGQKITGGRTKGAVIGITEDFGSDMVQGFLAIENIPAANLDENGFLKEELQQELLDATDKAKADSGEWQFGEEEGEAHYVIYY